MSFPYEDILHLPRPVSSRHPQMPAADRAAQFAPFAALNGHGEAIQETARLTDDRPELAEDGIAALNEQLCALARRLEERPWVELVCFVRDEKKPGGSYRTVAGRVEKMDVDAQLLVVDGVSVPMGDVFQITTRQPLTAW